MNPREWLELVDAGALKASGLNIRGGSNPSSRTKKGKQLGD